MKNKIFLNMFLIFLYFLQNESYVKFMVVFILNKYYLS